jgi:hypothetical protein
MDADFSIELSREDPVLDFPWTDPSGKLAYFDLKRQPELIAEVEEASKFSELAEFLRRVNSPRSLFESAKCDVWDTTELSAEEEIYDASYKFACYVDLVFSETRSRASLPNHENFARRLTELLRRAPEMAASVEICVRRCFFADPDLDDADCPIDGFYFTVYINGYGDDHEDARRKWAIAVELVSSAILQASSSAG